MDFLALKIKDAQADLQQIFTDISEIDLEDGFTYHSVEVNELENLKKDYSGFGVGIKYTFGNTKNKIQIDIGLGDVVKPEIIEFNTLKTNKGPLFSPENLEILAYPPEFIFSEKLQAAVMLAERNSRVKDYHDLYLLIGSRILNIEKIKDSIRQTFENRLTEISLIPDFNEETQARLQGYWKSHRKVLIGDTKDTLPKDFSEVVRYINDYLSSNNLV